MFFRLLINQLELIKKIKKKVNYIIKKIKERLKRVAQVQQVFAIDSNESSRSLTIPEM